MGRRILIANDDRLTRAGLRLILGQEADLEVVGEARDGREAVDLARTLQPDLVLMDLRMPSMDGLQATRALKRDGLVRSVLILSMVEDPDLLLEAVRAGAVGYVLKTADEAELRFAVRQALNREIAAELSITQHTVKVHVEHILAKLQVSHRTQAAVRGMELGYL